jgi:biopolymer transport protein ExbB
MRKLTLLVMVLAAICMVFCSTAVVMAQDGETSTEDTTDETAGVQPTGGGGTGFFSIVAGSGFLGIMLWMTLFGVLFAMVWFGVDCGITVRPAKIMPQILVDRVTEAIEEGDILKALQSCEDDPGALANILTAGFSHVEEGFETIQEAVGVAADLESEQLMQRISYLSVVGSISPMLGLLGTVQGMIGAFSTLADMGAAQISVLAADISQALYTTAAGLSVAVPALAMFFFFRNKASRIILKMEAITLELIKDLRNVEVVEE